MRIDARKTKSIPLYSTRAKYLLRTQKSSYTLEKENDNFELLITDTKEFWSISKYLVIEVDWFKTTHINNAFHEKGNALLFTAKPKANSQICFIDLDDRFGIFTMLNYHCTICLSTGNWVAIFENFSEEILSYLCQTEILSCGKLMVRAKYQRISWRPNVSGIRSKNGVDDREWPRNRWIQYLDILPTKTALMPYAKEMWLSAREISAHNYFERFYLRAVQKLRSSDIEHYFSHIVLSNRQKQLKPDKQILNMRSNLITLLVGVL